MSLPNIWHLRQVAETSAKPCDVCYKPSASVLITPDQKDFFYVCKSHLVGNSFATSIVDEAEAAARKRQEELDKEIEMIKQEYEKKSKKRTKAKKEKDKDAEGVQQTEDDAVKEQAEKIAAINKQRESTSKNSDGPRVFALQKVFYQRRLDRIRNAEYAKRNMELINNTDAFPSVPSRGF